MKHWYIIAYDIRQPKRLKRLHYYLKKHALHVQYSVFLVKADKHLIKTLKAGINNIIDKHEDDVRLYPTRHPDTLWAAGTQQQSLQGIYGGTPKQDTQNSTVVWIKTLIGLK